MSQEESRKCFAECSEYNGDGLCLYFRISKAGHRGDPVRPGMMCLYQSRWHPLELFSSAQTSDSRK